MHAKFDAARSATFGQCFSRSVVASAVPAQVSCHTCTPNYARSLLADRKLPRSCTASSRPLAGEALCILNTEIQAPNAPGREEQEAHCRHHLPARCNRPHTSWTSFRTRESRRLQPAGRRVAVQFFVARVIAPQQQQRFKLIDPAGEPAPVHDTPPSPSQRTKLIQNSAKPSKQTTTHPAHSTHDFQAFPAIITAQ